MILDKHATCKLTMAHYHIYSTHGGLKFNPSPVFWYSTPAALRAVHKGVRAPRGCPGISAGLQ